MHSPEMETLDQLIGGGLWLSLVRGFYPNDIAFLEGVHGLLSCGDVHLLRADREEVPHWRWCELFIGGRALKELAELCWKSLNRAQGA